MRQAAELSDEQTSSDANLPAPSSERSAWATAIALGVLGVAVLALVLSGTIGSVASRTSAGAPPVIAVTPTPMAGATASTGALASDTQPIVSDPSSVQAQRDLVLFKDQTGTHIAERWIGGFYPIYAVAQRTFGVNWLLIASIHKQESAFSTAPSTYHGLNFAACCGGPMQFNVTNGVGPATQSTWALVNDSYRYGARPTSYNHMTAKHPSIYDDFDSIMAAAHLLSADGAGTALDGGAWNAAYDYYGHDATGVTYADQVLARAISWSQHGFCINCGIEIAMVDAVHAAYGAPVAASLAISSGARESAVRHVKRRRK